MQENDIIKCINIEIYSIENPAKCEKKTVKNVPYSEHLKFVSELYSPYIKDVSKLKSIFILGTRKNEQAPYDFILGRHEGKDLEQAFEALRNYKY